MKNASLATDLFQVFKIDNEAHCFTSIMKGGLESRECVTPPSLPETSSALKVDHLLGISHLPHTVAYGALVEITSPTADELPEDDDKEDSMLLDSAVARVRQSPLDFSKDLVHDSRKRVAMRQPSLVRTKVSNSSLSACLRPEARFPPFRFNFGLVLPLDESFTGSSSLKEKPQNVNKPSNGGPDSNRSESEIAGLTNTSDFCHSTPTAVYTGKPSNLAQRQYRRSSSISENRAKITVQSVTDFDVRDDMLPHFFNGDKNDILPRISQTTFLNLLDGKFEDYYTQRIVIDCRFEYEYEGGHIDGAINFNDKELLARHLFETPMPGNILLVFHCEYSAYRAPLMACYIRSRDRSINAEVYPKLTYPAMYILDGGYSEFFAENKDRCYPQSYIQMNDQVNTATCEREMGKL